MDKKQAKFNIEVGEYLKKSFTKHEVNIFNIMLTCNDIFAQTYGYYPEEDLEWMKKLTPEFIKLIEDTAWEQFPPEDPETEKYLHWFIIAQLSQKIEK